MTYNYATKEGGALDQKLNQGLLTAVLETPDVNWLDAKSFKVSSVTTSGYKPHTRDKGFNAGSLQNPKQIYTLEFDRDIEFYVDSADVDETAQDLAAANISRVFIEEHAQPEVDAYRFMKLAEAAKAAGMSVKESITAENIYGRLKKAILPLRKYGPQNLIAYVSSEVMDALERSTEFVREISIATVGPATLESRVTSLDGVQLVEVWDEARFGTKYDFSDGFVPAAGSEQINFMIVAKPAIVCKAKFNAIYLFAPGEHTGGDGYLYQNRLYHDLFVLKNQKKAVACSVKAA